MVAIEIEHVVNASFVWPFESNFDTLKWHTFVIRNWHRSFYCAAAYLILIFVGQHLMRSRNPFKLRGLLFFWNVTMAVFSIMGSARTIEAFIVIFQKFSFYQSVCVLTMTDEGHLPGCWTLLYLLSKFVELGDTIFIVLRKRPLVFLHWYHHTTVLLYTAFSISALNNAPPMNMWFLTMNYTVHALMYSYYALTTVNIKVPRLISMSITVTQISQMFIGSTVSLFVFRYKMQGLPCALQYEILYAAILMYLSYFVLFLHFFYKSYILKKPIREIITKKEN